MKLFLLSFVALACALGVSCVQGQEFGRALGYEDFCDAPCGSDRDCYGGCGFCQRGVCVAVLEQEAAPVKVERWGGNWGGVSSKSGYSSKYKGGKSAKSKGGGNYYYYYNSQWSSPTGDTGGRVAATSPPSGPNVGGRGDTAGTLPPTRSPTSPPTTSPTQPKADGRSDNFDDDDTPCDDAPDKVTYKSESKTYGSRRE